MRAKTHSNYVERYAEPIKSKLKRKKAIYGNFLHNILVNFALNNKKLMSINSETKYCQTCGIPLDIDYTNLKADQNEEYCDYCLKNGVKLYDFSMDYLIYLWGLFPEEYYKEVGIRHTSSELREIMSRLFYFIHILIVPSIIIFIKNTRRKKA